MIELLRPIQPFAVSFLIGFVIGIDRERSHPAGIQATGVRSFTLLALLGTFAGWVNNVAIATALSIFAFVAILLGYMRATQQGREHPKSIGLTTEFTAAIVFCLGYMTLQSLALATIIGTVVLLVLVGRQRLHEFSREKLTQDEIRAATTMLVIALVFLPFLPDRAVDPWKLFNPQLFGVLVLVIAVIQFGGYVAIRVFGRTLGMILTGFFGGLVSSTAVFITMPHLVKDSPELTDAAIAASMLATVGMLVELAIILLLISQPLFITTIWSILAMIGVGLLCAFLIARHHIKTPIMDRSINPLDVRLVLRLAIIISGMIFLVALARHFIGVDGVHIFAFLAGLFNVQSITLATANLQIQQHISLSDASFTVALAVLASYITKFAILWSSQRNRFTLLTTVFLLLMMLAGAVAAYLI